MNILAGGKRASHAPIGPHSHQVGTLWSDTRNTQWHEIKGAGGKQSKNYECQLLRKANTVWQNPGMNTDDVCLMFKLKIGPSFPIRVGY